MSACNMDPRYGKKWFIFYAKVRPWFACFGGITAVSNLMMYADANVNFWWLNLAYLMSIIGAILCVLVAIKSNGDYEEFVAFVNGVLVFEIIYFSYQQGVQSYMTKGLDISAAVAGFLIAIILSYFLWYRLNIKYFKKRIISKNIDSLNTSGWRCSCGRFNLPHEKYCVCEKTQFGNLNYLQTGGAAHENSTIKDRILFCRKCGDKLIDGGRFCRKCGTEVIREE